MGMEAAVAHTYSEPRKVNKLQRENHGFPNHNFGTRCETNENVFALNVRSRRGCRVSRDRV